MNSVTNEAFKGLNRIFFLYFMEVELVGVTI